MEEAYALAGMLYRPRYTPVMRALIAQDPSLIGQIAEAAKITQPAATQTVALVIKEGLLVSEPSPVDGRQRLIRLSPLGRAMLPRLRECWKATQMAADSLDASLPRPLSQSLDEAIAALEVDSFANRIAKARTQRPSAAPPVGKATVKQHTASASKDAAKRKHTTAEKFADLLTSDLQSVGKDGHLEVRYGEDGFPELGKDGKPLKSFAEPERVKDRFAAAMTPLGDTRALIIDLRRNHGGEPDSVALLASYLFDTRTHRNDLYDRETDRTKPMWTSDTFDGPRYGSARKVYLVTSRDTFSAGEDLSYALKNLKRATLIGETTGGGAHPGQPRRLAEHFAAFVPSGRSISPITHTDWEGVGVAPDIEASAKNALDVAQLLALNDALAVEKDPQIKEVLTECVDKLK